MIRQRGAGLLLVLALAAPAAQAWGPEGHRVIGRIAEDQLTPAAHAAVAELLAGEPEPSLAGIANWADDHRNAHPETGPLHYLNMPKGSCQFVPARDCPDGLCVIGGIEQAIATLRYTAAPREQRLVALKNLVHFVGDVHQPLHAGLAEDRGGNSYKIQWAGKDDNLHRLWDSGLLSRIEPDAMREARRLEASAAVTPLGSLDALDWAIESCRTAQSAGFYPADHQPGDAYFEQWQPVVDARLRLAGLRLAGWLNRLF